MCRDLEKKSEPLIFIEYEDLYFLVVMYFYYCLKKIIKQFGVDFLHDLQTMPRKTLV